MMVTLRRILHPRFKPPVDFEKVDTNIEKAKITRDRLKQRKNLGDPIIARYYGYYEERKEDGDDQD